MSEENKVAGRTWHFAGCEFDELGRQLRVKGKHAEMESKPLDLLLQLLLHAGEVVTKEELLEEIWPDTMVVDGSLATAVSKLRKAIGEEVVVTVPRVGYRLAVPVYCKAVAAPAGPELSFRAGDSVPGREMWQLERPMDASGSGEVWLARNPRTGEQRIFKFAADGLRLKGLKREITVSRFLKESLGERPEFVRVLEWNLASPPFFIESEYSGANLSEWAAEQGGLDKCSLATRLKLLMDIAQTVAAAHSVGVIHKDLKPANILVSRGAEERLRIKIADFGSASLFDAARLESLGITNLGFTHTLSPDEQAITGTLMYLAPEVLAGQSPSTGSDVYALGVMLYQLVAGSFRKPLAPGWESEIDDPLLREDIAAAACGDPARRLAGALDLYDRLDSLEQRRGKRLELETAHRRALIAEKKVARARARRPWMFVTAAALLLGLAFSLLLYRRAIVERDRASHETAVADSINRFLTNDLLGQGNPFASGRSSQSFIEAVKQASPGIDGQFKNEPMIAGRLHQSIASALDARTDYPDARIEYDRAAALFRQADGAMSQDAMIAELQRAALEARSYEAGALALAKSILNRQEALMAKLPHPRPDLLVWDASARGMIALIGNDAKTAALNFQNASLQADALPQFDRSARLAFKQKLAFTYIRLGDGAGAEYLFRQLLAAYSATAGLHSPNVLRVRLNLAQAYMIQHKDNDAVRETSAIYPEFVSLLGPDHELTMQVLTTRAQSEGSLGNWAGAVRDDMTVYKLAVQKQGPLSFFAVATLSDAATAQCRAGELAEGAASARKAYQTSMKAFGPRSGLTGGTAYALAACLIGEGKVREASTLLKQIDVPAVAQLAGDPEFGAEVKLAQAQIAYRGGDYRTAKNEVTRLAPAFASRGMEPFEKKQFDRLKAALDVHSTQK